MATSAQTLSLIIDELVKAKPLDRDAAVTLLAAKGYLPKKLTEKPKEKKVSRFASKAAEDFADAKGIVVPDGFKGTAANDKISVKDLKQLAEGPKKAKVNASPSAQQFCRDNGLDITKVTGSGTEGKVLLKDVKDLKPTAKVDEDDDTDKRKISSAAAKLMKQYEIDEEDIVDVEGTGTNGTVVAKDLKELIDLIKAEKSDDSDSDDEEDDE
jgi:pyruvate/2-oxoglutarate dehydrogenase complex dihydrolipoamide acyltransferase (E2) component